MTKELYVFTFGVGQPNAGRCVRIRANTYEGARAEMVRLYGTTWSRQYDEARWEEVKENLKKHGIKPETPIGEVIEIDDFDDTINLCDTCVFCFATCEPESFEFGNGLGGDNVIRCSAYLSKITGVAE